MKALYSCDYCSYVTHDLDAMKKHESEHKETEKVVVKINAMIDEYNAAHSNDKFSLAHYKLNTTKPESPKGTFSKSAPVKDKKISCNCNHKVEDINPLLALYILMKRLEENRI